MPTPGSRFSQGRTVAYADLIESEALASRTAARLHLSESPRELASKVHASANPESVLLTLSVTDTSVDDAAKVANAMADDFVRLVADLETPADGSPPAARAVVVQRALGAHWVSPDRPRVVAFGLVSGLLLGSAVALLMRRPDESETHATPPINAKSDTTPADWRRTGWRQRDQITPTKTAALLNTEPTVVLRLRTTTPSPLRVRVACGHRDSGGLRLRARGGSVCPASRRVPVGHRHAQPTDLLFGAPGRLRH